MEVAGTRRIYRLDPAGVGALLATSSTRSGIARWPLSRTSSSSRRRRTHDQDSNPGGPSADRRRHNDSSKRPSPCSPSGSATSSRRSTTCCAAPIAETTFEPQVGGHIYDRAVDGSEYRWARDPRLRAADSRCVQLGHQAAVADRDRAGQHQRGRGSVRSREFGEAPRVELEHRNIERHGPDWEVGRRRCGRRGRLAACTWADTPPSDSRTGRRRSTQQGDASRIRIRRCGGSRRTR